MATVELEHAFTLAKTPEAAAPIRIDFPPIDPWTIPLVEYPDSDGEPMADSDDQYEAMTDAKYALVNYFRDDPMVYVAANLLIYYQRGDPTKRVAPDVFMVRGAAKRRRGSYRLWIERHLPNIVFEIASPGTYQRDLAKADLYASLHIPEYIMLDPSGGSYFGEPLTGYQLTPEGYERMPFLTETPTDRPDLFTGVFSRALGLELWSMPGGEDDSSFIFRFRHPETGEWLLSQVEGDQARLAALAEARQAQARARQAQARARQEAAARAAAEDELARLRAELARLRGQRTDE